MEKIKTTETNRKKEKYRDNKQETGNEKDPKGKLLIYLRETGKPGWRPDCDSVKNVLLLIMNTCQWFNVEKSICSGEQLNVVRQWNHRDKSVIPWDEESVPSSLRLWYSTLCYWITHFRLRVSFHRWVFRPFSSSLVHVDTDFLQEKPRVVNIKLYDWY